LAQKRHFTAPKLSTKKGGTPDASQGPNKKGLLLGRWGGHEKPTLLPGRGGGENKKQKGGGGIDLSGGRDLATTLGGVAFENCHLEQKRKMGGENVTRAKRPDENNSLPLKVVKGGNEGVVVKSGLVKKTNRAKNGWESGTGKPSKKDLTHGRVNPTPPLSGKWVGDICR